MTTTAEFIAGFEGYAGRAYWDVNAWRLGYGSDTEGPDQVKVTEGMETTKARALQNLTLRIPQFQTEAVYGKTGMGRDTWEKLTENQKTAITSLVYNYGRLPIIITPSDTEKTAHAIGALRTANGGVNARRRIQEAGLYLTPDAGFAPKPQAPQPSQPAPPAPIPQVPSPPPVPIPVPPPSAPPAAPPPISSTIAGLDAAILDHFGAILDALTKQRDAINVRIAKIQAQAADFATLEGVETSPPPPILQIPAASPAVVTTAQGTTNVFGSITINWKTALSGIAAGAFQGLAATYPQYAPIFQIISGAALGMLGVSAKDSNVTGGTVSNVTGAVGKPVSLVDKQ